MSTVFRARWVLPIAAPPIVDGWVEIGGGRILGLGTPQTEPAGQAESIDLGRAVILPGLVNAHTHLELSWMKGRLTQADAMPRWAAGLMALRRTVSAEPEAPIVEAVAELRAAGTSVVGDVTNTLAAYDALADSHLAAAIFRELLGFNTPDPERVVAEAAAALAALTTIEWLRASIVPHAPYSVSPDLFRAIAATPVVGARSVHLAESAEELQFLQDGTGAWREILGELGVWNDRWAPPGCGAVEYLDRLGLLTSRLLAVHCVHTDDGELVRLREAGATVVTCPRSNRFTGAGDPPIERFYGSGVRVAIGTDSLASVEDLSLFAEMAAVRRVAPHVPAAALLESATRHGADALGFGDEFGTIAQGKRADLIAVTVPASVEDVEEYLVARVQPTDIRWLEAMAP